MPPKAVLFDFEGTLVDFQWQLQAAVDETVATLTEAGYATDSFGTTPSYVDIYNQSAQLIAAGSGICDGSESMRIIDSIYDAYDADAASRWQLYPDAVGVLKQLRSDGYRLGLVSNVGNAALTEAVARLGLVQSFEIVISRDDVTRLKPHPEGLLRAVDALRTTVADTVFVGDSINDLRAAKAAGMTSFLLRGGEDCHNSEAESQSDLQIDSLSQLAEALKSR